VIVRIPLIPGCNDQPSEMAGIADMIREVKPSTPVNILPYHQFAEQKYQRIGKEYRLKGLKPLSPDQLKRLGQVFEDRGLCVTIKGWERTKHKDDRTILRCIEGNHNDLLLNRALTSLSYTTRPLTTVIMTAISCSFVSSTW